MSDTAEPLDLDAIRGMAERQADAYATMLHIDEGVGGLGIRWPSKFQYMRDWSDATENDHADTVLTLLAEVERLRAEVSDLVDEAIRQKGRANEARAALTTARRDALTEAADAEYQREGATLVVERLLARAAQEEGREAHMNDEEFVASACPHEALDALSDCIDGYYGKLAEDLIEKIRAALPPAPTDPYAQEEGR